MKKYQYNTLVFLNGKSYKLQYNIEDRKANYKLGKYRNSIEVNPLTAFDDILEDVKDLMAEDPR